MSVNRGIDWRAWTARWDRQQEGYLPDREERFGLMLDYVERARGAGSLRVLDLCCGPGSIGARALRRFPQATILAVDIDPWLVEMGRQTVGREWPGRVEWREADLRRADWSADLVPGSFDAVLTATALHWFQPEDLMDLYRRLAGLLAEGGVFLNADHFPTGAATLDGLGKGILGDIQAANFASPGSEDWAAYWDAARAEPAFADLLAERERRFNDRPRVISPRIAYHHEALRAVGFRETAEVWRRHQDAILAALR